MSTRERVLRTENDLLRQKVTTLHRNYTVALSRRDSRITDLAAKCTALHLALSSVVETFPPRDLVFSLAGFDSEHTCVNGKSYAEWQRWYTSVEHVLAVTTPVEG
jgi:hypothetical protein